MTKIKVTNRKNGGSPILSDGGVAAHIVSGQGQKSQKNYRQRPLAKATSSGNDDYIDSQFQKPPIRVPTRSITLAMFLCCAGTVLLSLGVMVITGHLDSRFEDRVWPMIIMGFLMFIPGAYHVRIFVCALKGIPGYSFEDIPEFE